MYLYLTLLCNVSFEKFEEGLFYLVQGIHLMKSLPRAKKRRRSQLVIHSPHLDSSFWLRYVVDPEVLSSVVSVQMKCFNEKCIYGRINIFMNSIWLSLLKDLLFKASYKSSLSSEKGFTLRTT
ncbi:hypothetical protein AVEN_255852-1 [Araneus ventricosus]|uniref:Uncharacterized protein n=1 Tax=Araneus ventricosus TaxID=182803 RepID=A0A4Y2EKT1_ARAVE|nr:hypothetical protein AVEN_255852-1 [Araneus ventricosus]